MADIFISYSSAERQITQALASDLEAAGYSVWWDTSLVPGDVFKDVIEEKIAASKAAIVIWTKASVKSKWVYSEATRADAQGKLVPLRTADIASADIPMPFGATHTDVVDNRAGIAAALERLGVRPAPRPAPQPAPPPDTLPTEADEQRRARMARMKAEEEHWDLIKRSRDGAALRSFLAHYPDGTFAATARARLEQVEGAGGNSTGMVGALAAVALAVVGVGAWWLTSREAIYPPPQPSTQREATARDKEAKPTVAGSARIASGVNVAKPAPMHDCDRLAESPYQSNKLTAGVPSKQIQPEAAAACERALRDFPTEVRFWFQLGRSYLASGNYPKAKEWYEKAAAAGSSIALAGLASISATIASGFVDYPRAAKLLLQAASSDEQFSLSNLRGEMADWPDQARTELKRELARLGHYKGPIDDKWNDAARAAFERYLKAQ